MAEVLYRKYRPQKFSDLVGQEHVRVTLENQIKNGSVGHAYLFTGPRGVGKTTSARLLAKAVNCLKRGEKAEPCNKCDACDEITSARSLDVIEIDAASHTGVDNVRENIIENVRFAPTQRKFKVFIIDEVHMLSTSAFNALLKTLEEPPDHAMFILATTEIHKVPQTIISRCQRFDFRRIGTADLVKRLAWIAKQEGVSVDKDVLAEVARHSDGGQRDAESLLAQIFALGEKNISMEEASLVLPASQIKNVIDLCGFIAKNDAPAAVRLVNTLVNDGVDIGHFNGDMIAFLRQLILAKLGDRTSLTENLSDENIASAETLLDLLSAEQIINLIELVTTAKNTRSNIAQLPLEMAIVKSTSISSVPEYSLSEVEGLVEGLGSGSVEESVKKKSEPEIVQEKPSAETPREPELEPVSKAELESIEVVEIALPEKNGESVNFTTVKGKWEEISDRVADAHTSLSYLLRNADLLGCDNNELRLGFNFKFHADTMNAQKNRMAIETIMQKVLGSKVKLMGEYVNADSDVVVGDLVENFGGKEV